MKGKLGNLLIHFSKRTTFWDIVKWNRGITIWDKACAARRPSMFSPHKLSTLKASKGFQVSFFYFFIFSVPIDSICFYFIFFLVSQVFGYATTPNIAIL